MWCTPPEPTDRCDDACCPVIGGHRFLTEALLTRVLLMATSDNGLTKRARLALLEAGHEVRLAVVATADDKVAATVAADFDIIICPFLKSRIPEGIWRSHRTVVIHPGPVGDRGPSSLDWAIMDGEPIWGVTALSAVEEMDAGPIWATRTFPMPLDPPWRKSAVYNGPVSDAAVECALEVAAKAEDPGFVPVPAEEYPRAVASARLRPAVRRADRLFSWDSPADAVVRSVCAADGAPGIRVPFGAGEAFAYGATADGPCPGVRPGHVVATCLGAVRVATRDSSVWISHLRAVEAPSYKLTAVATLTRREFGPVLDGVPEAPVRPGPQEIGYTRDGDVGTLRFDFHNGAMDTNQCRRLLAAYRAAVDEDTRVLVLAGGREFFSNGIHLNVIESADNPALEAWHNIRAINDVCRAITLTTTQVVVGAFTGNAGAGGVMLPLGADVVAARAGVVLDPHYATMGLYGSELHTFTLPRRVGAATAHRLTTACRPVGTAEALEIGLVDAVGPRGESAFAQWLAELARSQLANASETLTLKRKSLAAANQIRPIDAYEAHELAEMSEDMFADRNGFAEKRRSFVLKI